LKTELTTAECHDSEAGDVYALFNAVDGVIVDGLLDVSKLDDYGPEDAEALNVSRLRQVFEHTASGCKTCEDIIKALTHLRESLEEVVI
jgi:hypothetical protein